ncbi:hypothetical protein N431DRAFT_121797 [Stipitochalara longipes BDJ]|nr:hypothetical protein N431DRAFT_121797 [Stipitochalara longipes BDJ]
MQTWDKTEQRKEGRFGQEDTYSYPTAADQSSSKLFFIRSRMLMRCQSCSDESDGCARHCFVCTCQLRSAVSGQSNFLGSAPAQPCDGERQIQKPPAFSAKRRPRILQTTVSCAQRFIVHIILDTLSGPLSSVQEQLGRIINYPTIPRRKL